METVSKSTRVESHEKADARVEVDLSSLLSTSYIRRGGGFEPHPSAPRAGPRQRRYHIDSRATNEWVLISRYKHLNFKDVSPTRMTSLSRRSTRANGSESSFMKVPLVESRSVMTNLPSL